MNENHGTAFVLETLLMTCIMIGVVLLLTRSIAAAGSKSTEAAQLTNAVCLAENAAEAFSVSPHSEGMAELLNVSENACADGNQVTAFYSEDLEPLKDGSYRVLVEINEEKGRAGNYITAHITVDIDGKSYYSLDTAVYEQEGAA